MTLRSSIRTALAALAVLAGTMAAEAATRPVFVIETWFSGPAVATGQFRNSIDGSVRGVEVRFKPRWDGHTLTLREDIRYSDGEREVKTWHLTKTGPGTYVGRRDDILGEAVGFTDALGRLRLQYKAKVGERYLSFDDTLALQPDGSVINTATVSYLFLHVGDVELHFRRPGR